MIIIKYKCTDCTNTFTFYNRCSFLLHVRKHFSLNEGYINLSNVDIRSLPLDLAGFDRHESFPFLYDEEEEFVDGDTYINNQFYTPDANDAGKEIITMHPYNLSFRSPENPNEVPLVLKQISLNFPLCEFVHEEYEEPTQDAEVPVTNGDPEPEPELEPEPEIKQEVQDEFTLPIISKIESLSYEKLHCTECKAIIEGSLLEHFQGRNKPLDQSLYCYICKYVAPTKCSQAAHLRTHENGFPFVCPECGKNFESCETLDKHMDNVCFHLCKQVRYRCPAYKCGKLFVLPNTYSAHFSNHFYAIFRCSECSSNFLNESDFAEHAKTHECCTAVKSFNCLVCKNSPTLETEEAGEHIRWHLEDRERMVYIFMCRSCRSYFRSTNTYAVHKQKCQKDKTSNLITGSCHFCSYKMQFKEKDTFKACNNCKQINHLRVTPGADEKKVTCLLCTEEVNLENKNAHMKLCKYNNPIVAINACNESKESDETNSNEKSSDTENKASCSSGNDSAKTPQYLKIRKRKRSAGYALKNKKVEETDLQADKPIAFDGTYYCRLCDYRNTERPEFHQHIMGHRDISTSYQCMECGECFVVKPSLIKHLTHFHKITDPNQYFAENECYDKHAIEELQNKLKLGLGEHQGPVEENQCRICLKKFEDTLELSNHFRVHGMAFLMRKTP